MKAYHLDLLKYIGYIEAKDSSWASRSGLRGKLQITRRTCADSSSPICLGAGSGNGSILEAMDHYEFVAGSHEMFSRRSELW